MFNSQSSRLAQPTTLPDFDRPFGLPAFNSIGEAISSYDGDDAIYVLYPKRIEAAADLFLKRFPGKVLYAVKANPHPAVLKILWASGIRGFDVASIREIDLVKSVCPDAEMFLMHPVKSRRTIRHAYAAGIRHFAFDCAAELGKILVETDDAEDLHLHLRLALPKGGSASMPLDGKYGANYNDSVELLRSARSVAAKLGVCFHVGSQCMDPADYIKALSYVHGLLETADIRIDSVDVGGGFPVAYPGLTPPPMQDYFARIEKGLKIFGFGDLEIIGEPGRALCGEGGSTLARVELRKGKDLYLNEGSYGSLFDAAQCAWKYPVKLHRDGQASDTSTGYRFFGPTCDSLDAMAGPFDLPSDVHEGDWIEICHLGAYGQALATDFNGFQSDTTVAILG
ncbi:MAG: type III PLP-dependent enzyme [Hyphomonadaceae bacterium]|nr:type III PLP-dependent enzyme [Hyphomonadaceae bacterium]